MALSFDEFQTSDRTRNLRHVCVRPKGQKVALGRLAEGLKSLAADYDRVIGGLVSRGKTIPILAVVHLRYDQRTQAWDPHIHCLLRVTREHLESVTGTIQRNFSTVWVDNEPIRNPRALANYILSWVVDYRATMHWPDSAILEIFNLRRPRLVRPAGPFARHRRALKDKALSRQGDRIVLKERAKRPKGQEPATRTPQDGERIVAIVMAKIGGRKRPCAVLKRQRLPKSSTASPPVPLLERESAPVANAPLHSCDYPRNSSPVASHPPDRIEPFCEWPLHLRVLGHAKEVIGVGFRPPHLEDLRGSIAAVQRRVGCTATQAETCLHYAYALERFGTAPALDLAWRTAFNVRKVRPQPIDLWGEPQQALFASLPPDREKIRPSVCRVSR